MPSPAFWSPDPEMVLEPGAWVGVPSGRQNQSTWGCVHPFLVWVSQGNRWNRIPEGGVSLDVLPLPHLQRLLLQEGVLGWESEGG